jgi:hypothetical protein
MSAASHIDRARIYVSFADEDRARAMELVRWLNDSGWHVAADDRHSFAAEDEWSPPSRLDSCDVVLCLITPGWLVSRFCHHEFSYSAKKGKFILPVICELPEVGLLPEAIRALPRVDFRRNRLLDYLALKDVLSQAGPKIGGAPALDAGPHSGRSVAWRTRDPGLIGMLLAAVMLAAIVTFWFWARG